MYHSMQVHYYICYAIKMQFKGVLHPEMLDILFFLISRYFLQFKLQICAYTQLESKIKKKLKKFSGGVVRNSTEPPKI